ncbi:hypothetical protein COA01_34740 [Bacillus cereus]|uniref:hypothetical protein n=1 Tax=Bacillus cereus TaxID=1396 RepID=UPI000BFC8939|nr:hypothetical protein [Bacillus cereus]PGP11980.1 hypothetical protein COA01_34740 [Bacillus cereus]
MNIKEKNERIKSTIYKKLKEINCNDIARMKMVRKVFTDCQKVIMPTLWYGKLFAEEVYEERGKEFYIQVGELDWQFTEKGDCIHGSLRSLSKQTIELLKELGREKDEKPK